MNQFPAWGRNSNWGKKSKNCVEAGSHVRIFFFEVLNFSAKLSIFESDHSQIKWSICHELSGAKNCIRFGLQLRKLWGSEV